MNYQSRYFLPINWTSLLDMNDTFFGFKYKDSYAKSTKVPRLLHWSTYMRDAKMYCEHRYCITRLY